MMKRYLSILVAVVFIIGIGFVAKVDSNTYLLSPTDDSWVYSYAADTNYGSGTGIATAIAYMSPRGYAFLKFSIPTLNGESIQSATLHLYQFDGAGYGEGPTAIGLFSSNNWFENNATWKNIAYTASMKHLATNSNGHSHKGWSSWSFPWDPLYGNIISLYVGENSSGDQSHWWYSKEYSNENLRPHLELITKNTIYFPHVDTNLPWQTEIAIINTGDQPVTGTLRALGDEGQLVGTKDVTLSAHGRRQITVADEFTNHTNIGYIVFDTASAAVQGYTKFYQAGKYRAAIPAVKEVNASDIYISHIDSGALWWTGISLVNTTSATKELTITFDNGQSGLITLTANQHKAFTIREFFNNQPQPPIKSAVITNASGIIGLELFGTNDGKQLEGIPVTDKTASTLYYPHVESNGWWTGIVAYNPSNSGCTITITPYTAQGTPLSPINHDLTGKETYVGVVANLGLPSDTAWFRIDATSPITGFELFGTADDNQLAAYAGGGGTGSKSGVFAKIEEVGWTGIAFVNTEAGAASVTLIAYNDAGTVVATQALPVGGHTKVVKLAEEIFSQSISGATYIAYSSDKNVVGFQLNGSSDGMMLDGLPALGGTN